MRGRGHLTERSSHSKDDSSCSTLPSSQSRRWSTRSLRFIVLLLSLLPVSDSFKGIDCTCLQWPVIGECLYSCRHLLGLGRGKDKKNVARVTENVDELLGNRTWISRTKSIQGRSIKFLTYNILADCYAKKEHFPEVNPRFLTWQHRKHSLLQIIDAVDADVICLQEVDHYEAFVDPELRARGYEGVYKQRNGIDKQDGCATFWKRKSFRLVHSRAVELDGAIERARPYIETPSYITHNVAVYVILQHVEESQRNDSKTQQDPSPQPRRSNEKMMCIANAHLFWNPQFSDLKLIQAKTVVREIDKIERQFGHMTSLLMGDFNSMPQTRVYHFITEDAGFESAYRHMFALLNASSSSPSPSPPLPSLLPPQASEPLYTNYRQHFKGTLDYIFFRCPAEEEEEEEEVKHCFALFKFPALFCSLRRRQPTYAEILAKSPPSYTVKRRKRLPSKFVVESVLDVPSPQDLGSQGLPDKSQPSDHLPLVCRAKLREKTET